MNHAGLVVTKLDPTRFEALDHAADVGADGAALGVGQQAARPEQTRELLADGGHHVGGGHHGVEVHESTRDAFDQFIATGHVSASSFGSGHVLTLGDGGHAHRAARAVGQGNRAAHVLVALAGVDAQAEVNFHGLVELGRGDFLHQGGSLVDGVLLIAVDLGDQRVVTFAVLRHWVLLQR